MMRGGRVMASEEEDDPFAQLLAAQRETNKLQKIQIVQNVYRDICMTLLIAAAVILCIFALSYRSTVNGLLEDAGLIMRDLATPQDLTLLRGSHTPEQITSAGLISRILAKAELMLDDLPPILRKAVKLMVKGDYDLAYVSRVLAALPPYTPQPNMPSGEPDDPDSAPGDPNSDAELL